MRGQLAVDQLGAAVEDAAEGGGVNLCTDFLLGTESGDVVEVELQAAVEVGVEGGRRDEALLARVEASVEPLEDFGSLVDTDGRGAHGHLSGGDGGFADVVVALGEELEHEARHLAAVESVGRGIVEQGDVLGALHEAVEVVGIDGVLVFEQGHAEGLPQVVGDERRVAAALGELAFVEREHHDVFEVEVAGLEHAHDLQPDGGFTVEGDGGGREDLVHEAGEGRGLHAEGAALDEATEAVHGGVCLEERLAVELVEGVRGGCLLTVERGGAFECHLQVGAEGCVPADGCEEVRQQLVRLQLGGKGIEAVARGEGASEWLCFGREAADVGMLQHDDDGGVVIASRVGVIAFGLEADEGADEAVDGRLGEGEAHGDVDVPHGVGGQGVEDGLEERLVAEDDGGLGLLLAQVGAQPVGEEACLRVLRRGGDVLDFLVSGEGVEVGFGQLGGEVAEVASDELARLVVGGVEVADVVVPVEERLPGSLEFLEEEVLHAVEDVETDEDVVLVGQGGGIERFAGFAVEHALVGDVLCGEVVAEAVVDVAQDVPQGDEALFELGSLADGEVAEELTDGVRLLVVEEVECVVCLEVLEVGEEPVGVDAVLVDVIEVADEQLAPEVEFVECLVAPGGIAEDLVEAAHEFDGVAHAAVGQ